MICSRKKYCRSSWLQTDSQRVSRTDGYTPELSRASTVLPNSARTIQLNTSSRCRQAHNKTHELDLQPALVVAEVVVPKC